MSCSAGWPSPIPPAPPLRASSVKPTLQAVDDLDASSVLELFDRELALKSWAKSISPCCSAATIASALVNTRNTIRSMPLSLPYQFGFFSIVQSWPDRHSVSEYWPDATPSIAS